MESLQGTALTNIARTATATSADFSNPFIGARLTLYIDVTVDANSASITPSLQGYDVASTKWFTFWTAAAPVASVAQTSYALGPGLLASVSGGFTDVENVVVPATWRLVMTAADSDEIEYGVGWALS